MISKVDEHTDWCSPMVMVPKANGNVRICVDLTQLNRSVKREMHIIPSVEDLYVGSSEEWESFQQTTQIQGFERFAYQRSQHPKLSL